MRPAEAPAVEARARATLIGGVAVLLWALLALLTTVAGGIPPFQLRAMSFAMALLVGAARLCLHGCSAWNVLRQRPAVWLLGIGGLFGYHYFYFVALARALRGVPFFVWDHGSKHGDIQLLATFAYAAPLLSTVLLIAFGMAAPSPLVAVAATLVVGGTAP